MGISSSTRVRNGNQDDIESESWIKIVFSTFGGRSKVPIEIQVAHFTPANFPMIPILNARTAKLCADSWLKIMTNETVYMSTNSSVRAGTRASGITLFYDEFYARLDQFDTNKKFEKLLVANSHGQNKILAKGSIIVRVVKYVLAIQDDTPAIRKSLIGVGRSHNKMKIRAWQYSVFVQTLLLTISSRLGTNATNDVMEAWVHLFAYVLKHLLPTAIKGRMHEEEFNINTAESDGQ